MPSNTRASVTARAMQPARLVMFGVKKLPTVVLTASLPADDDVPVRVTVRDIPVRATPGRDAVLADGQSVPEPVFPEEDPYPAYRSPRPVVRERTQRSPIDEYILAAVIATGTALVQGDRAQTNR